MYPQPGDKSELLKEPIYFYYSNCYYHENTDRMNKKWQVGRGNTSWAIDIAELKYKGSPRLDLAMKLPEFGECVLLFFLLKTKRRTNTFVPEFRIDAEPFLDATWDAEDFDNFPRPWLKPLLQFRNHDGVTLQFCDNKGLRTKPKLEAFISTLKEYMSGPPIGPRICPFFHGRPYGNGNDPYPTGYPRR
jgi:hypothetical protein